MAEVELHVENGLARITLDRPPLNILTTAMLLGVAESLERAGRDAAVRVVRLDARGKMFSAGVDVGDHIGDKVDAMMDALARLFAAFERLEAPSVAVVHGAALGGGFELCLGADLVLASTAARFAQPEIRLGLFAPPASVLLPRRIGEGRALDLLLSGDAIDAERAERVGLVDRVLPADGFDDAVTERIDALLALSGPALRLAKRAVRESRGRTVLAAHEAVDRIYREELMRTADAQEGLAAFLEKRAPRWRHG